MIIRWLRDVSSNRALTSFLYINYVHASCSPLRKCHASERNFNQSNKTSLQVLFYGQQPTLSLQFI